MPHLTLDDNELLIAESGGLPVILDAARTSSLELQAQSARALRNLSVHQANKEMLAKLDGVPTLQRLAGSSNERIAQQVIRSEASTPPAHALTTSSTLPSFHFRVPPRNTQGNSGTAQPWPCVNTQQGGYSIHYFVRDDAYQVVLQNSNRVTEMTHSKLWGARTQ